MALPRGYTKLEYIESTGTQYIDTGFNPTYQTRVVTDLLMGAYTSTAFAYGARDTSSQTAAKQFCLAAFTNANTIRCDYFGTSKNTTATGFSDGSTRVTVDQNKNVTTCGSTTVTNTAVSSGVCAYSLWLFTLNSTGDPAASGKLKLYSCQIYDNGTMVRDFLPCANPSGEVGLWDDVNGVFYGNSGTGAFVAGPAAVQGGTPIKNLVPTDGWSLSGVTYENGVFTFDPGVVAMATVAMPTPSAGHKYYGRAMQMAPDGLTFADHRFEWYLGDAENSLMVFATLEGTGDQWRIDSAVMSLNAPVDGSWTIRNFIVNGSSTTYRKELLIVDLTESFGEGNEPNKAWCDENIPYFTGTITLAEQPEGFSVLDATTQAVILLWGAPEDRCRLYRNDALVYEGTDSHYTDAGLVPGLTYTYRLTGYSGSHETTGVALDAQTRESILLITDRTAADVSAGTRKGRYNAVDLIRVGEAMAFLEERFAAVGISVSVSPKLDWQLSDIPTQAQALRYLTDIGVLRGKLTEFRETVSLPGSLTALTWGQANDIEAILLDAEKLIRDIVLSYRHYSGRTISGVNALP